MPCWPSQSRANDEGIMIATKRSSRPGIWGLACVLVLWTAPLFARGADADRSPAIENSVVKVFATLRYPDPFKPWTKQAPNEVTASGVVIEGRRILTNA